MYGTHMEIRSAMDMSLFVLLLLSGLLWSASCRWREYYYINKSMTWSAAQSYCRERFTDLATVDSMNDVNRMMNTVNDGHNRSVWIGLKRMTKSRWVWSMRDHTPIKYSAWCPGQPSGDGECVSFAGNVWYDRPCGILYYFVCYNETNGYIVISLLKNWTDAQRYCREFHTDLASIRNVSEQKQLFSVVGSSSVWIGLYSDPWKWSDQWNLFFRNWAVGQQFQTLGQCVAMSTTDSGKWVRYGCDQHRLYICYGEEKFVKKQTVRLNLSHDGRFGLNDPSVQTTMLNEISEKLKSVGLGGYKNISWSKDEDGEVFHLNERTVQSNDACDEYTEDE